MLASLNVAIGKSESVEAAMAAPFIYTTSCVNPGALARLVHVLHRATSFEDGVRVNLLVGGDNASTALGIGAVLGVVYGVPPAWESQYKADANFLASLE